MVLFEIKVNFWNFILKIEKISESIIQLIESLQAMNFDYMLLVVGEQIHLLVCYWLITRTLLKSYYIFLLSQS